MSKLLKERADIENWLEEHKIENYTLMPDKKYGYIVDVEGNVELSNKNLLQIEVKFGTVREGFSCSHNGLKSLLGCPDSVGGEFNCCDNKLKSLQYAPSFVGKGFLCSNNQLTTLDYAPQYSEDFYCNNNKIVSLRGAPISVRGAFICSDNRLTNLEYCPVSVGSTFQCEYNKLDTFIYLPEILHGRFFCNRNEGLGHYQTIEDFMVIKEKGLSDREKLQLCASLSEAKKCVKSYKI